jgi:hypothetical protein
MRWNAAIVEMDRYYKTPIFYTIIWVLKCFVILLKNRFMKLHFLEPIYGDETKWKATTAKNLELEISEQFFLSLSYNNEPLSLDKVKKTIHY